MFFDKFSTFLHQRNLYFVLPYFSTVFHWLTVGSSKMAISFAITLSSTWSLYENSGNCAHMALKAYNISNLLPTYPLLSFLTMIVGYLQIFCDPVYIWPIERDILFEIAFYLFLPSRKVNPFYIMSKMIQWTI